MRLKLVRNNTETASGMLSLGHLFQGCCGLQSLGGGGSSGEREPNVRAGLHQQKAQMDLTLVACALSCKSNGQVVPLFTFSGSRSRPRLSF